MKLARFNETRLGAVVDDGTALVDLSELIADLPHPGWAPAPGDPVVARLPQILEQAPQLIESAPRLPLADVTLNAPVATPSKIIGAPVNYHAHLDEAEADAEIHHGNKIAKIDEIGCFLKASSALFGPGAKMQLPFINRRVDHEGEVAVVIGHPGRRIKAADAMDHVAGFALAFDMTVRGTEDRSLRKSFDTSAGLGPWLTTADEIADAADIPFELTVNGDVRQSSNTRLLIRSVPQLIEMVSAFYTLLPGDIIMTGTPEGVSPVAAGDVVTVSSPLLGAMSVHVID
ncbi:fumarylacetoacetate hydrolase family protein [Pseudaestuariivita sp.]|uniref:fumarylacetoacetate hydrolase family protein n=1 Tax=Pseudaestuariivita sp. TaxID=2211669 RepID=UPI00405838D8